jgi:lipopolysaccharide biosynthesis glycosyltransferase
MKAVVVTAADEDYAPFLRDLLDSLEPHREALDFAIAVLDLGLLPPTAAAVAARVEHLVEPHWPFKPHAEFSSDRRHLSRAARPVLPDLVPGYDVYVWLDADVWVQHPLGLSWLIEAAATADIAAVPVVHRAYRFRPADLGWLLERYRMAFSNDIALDLMQRPYFNAGVFAIAAGSPLWRAYAKHFQAALDRWQGSFLSDQAVINAAIMLDGLSMQRLPARTNWICHLASPLWQPQTLQLLEPALPFDPLLIVHNTFKNKNFACTLPSTDGGHQQSPLTYSAVRALSATAALDA